MKTKKIYTILVSLALFVSSCNNFLDNDFNSNITGGNLTDENLPALTAPLYNLVWFDFNNNFYFGLGDGMGYNILAPFSDYLYPFADLMVNGLTGPLSNAWNSFFVVVQQSNTVIKSISESSVPQPVKDRFTAEARFMRGVAYWHLASLWHDVPIIEDPALVAANPLRNTNPRRDVFEYAIRDIEFAAKHLPETQTQAGRVNRYAAFGMLSRLYLAYSGLVASDFGQNPNVGTRDAAYLELAKKAAEMVIRHSQFRLLENYPDLFMIEHNNNSESLFALQWVPGLNNTTGYGFINPHQAYLAASAAITGSSAWGGSTNVPYDMISEYEPNDIIRRRATWMGWGDFYPELMKAEGGLLYQDLNQGTFIGEASTALHAKKGVTGSTRDNPAIGNMNSALNTYMLRLAEVYLNYAEAIMGNSASTSDAVALDFFNRVRTRTGELAPKTSLTWEDFRKERRVEFCLEGRYWYDLVSRSYYRQQEVINYINGQNRGELLPILFSAPNNLRIDPDRNSTMRSVGTANTGTFKLPYPESDLIINPLLREAPVSYSFTENRMTDLFD
jgi:hypothetical protein